MDFCPAYWDWLDQQYAAGELASIEMVYVEMANGGDELATWVRARRDHFVSVSDEDTQAAFVDISNHVVALPDKKQASIAAFLGGADPWLTAKAMTSGATVVTSERKVDANSKKIKIPNVCEDFSVDYIDSFELLRTLQAQFVLGP
jgi:hypothetical protein